MIKLFNERALATVAQSVEQLIRNQQVAGSSPASSSKDNTRILVCVLFFGVDTEKADAVNVCLFVRWIFYLLLLETLK